MTQKVSTGYSQGKIGVAKTSSKENNHESDNFLDSSSTASLPSTRGYNASKGSVCNGR